MSGCPHEIKVTTADGERLAANDDRWRGDRDIHFLEQLPQIAGAEAGPFRDGPEELSRHIERVHSLKQRPVGLVDHDWAAGALLHPAGEAGVVRVEMSQDDQGDPRKTADRLLEFSAELGASRFGGKPGIDQHPSCTGFEGIDMDFAERERHWDRELKHSVVGNLHRRSPFSLFGSPTTTR